MADDILERWLPVVGYEGLYSVSDLGRVRSESRRFTRKNGRVVDLKGRVLRTTKMPTGYMQADLRLNGRHKHFYVHRLVLTAFVCQAPEKHEACHNNGIRDDNRLCNLRWDTRSSNHADKHLHGTALVGKKHPFSRISEELVLRLRAMPRHEAYRYGRSIGLTSENVYSIHSRKTWKCLTS